MKLSSRPMIALTGVGLWLMTMHDKAATLVMPEFSGSHSALAGFLAA